MGVAMGVTVGVAVRVAVTVGGGDRVNGRERRLELTIDGDERSRVEVVDLGRVWIGEGSIGGPEAGGVACGFGGMMALRMRVGAVGDGREALVDVKSREAAGDLGGTVEMVGLGVCHGAGEDG